MVFKFHSVGRSKKEIELISIKFKFIWKIFSQNYGKIKAPAHMDIEVLWFKKKDMQLKVLCLKNTFGKILIEVKIQIIQTWVTYFQSYQ